MPTRVKAPTLMGPERHIATVKKPQRLDTSAHKKHFNMERVNSYD